MTGGLVGDASFAFRLFLSCPAIVAAVSIPRIVATPKLPSRYGKCGHKRGLPVFFNRIFHTRRSGLYNSYDRVSENWS